MLAYGGEEIFALNQIYQGCLLHDIGKIWIPDEILLKPGPLNPMEISVIRQHPTLAFELLRTIRALRHIAEIPYSHHERWDGTGYPRGLSGEDIPLPARILSVVDVWDALTSDRLYRKAWPREQVLAYIFNERQRHFDPDIVNAFIEVYNRGEL